MVGLGFAFEHSNIISKFELLRVTDDSINIVVQ